MDLFYVLYKTLKIVKGRIAPEEIKFPVVFKIIDDRMLFNGFRITAGKFRQLHIRYAGQRGKETSRRGKMWCKATAEKDAAVRHGLEKRGRV